MNRFFNCECWNLWNISPLCQWPRSPRAWMAALGRVSTGTRSSRESQDKKIFSPRCWVTSRIRALRISWSASSNWTIAETSEPFALRNCLKIHKIWLKLKLKKFICFFLVVKFPLYFPTLFPFASSFPPLYLFRSPGGVLRTAGDEDGAVAVGMHV